MKERMFNKKIVKIIELVSEINSKGGRLWLSFDNAELSIYDLNERKSFLSLKTKNVVLNEIYFSEYWEDCYETCVSQAISQLEKRLEEI